MKLHHSVVRSKGFKLVRGAKENVIEHTFVDGD